MYAWQYRGFIIVVPPPRHPQNVLWLREVASRRLVAGVRDRGLRRCAARFGPTLREPGRVGRSSRVLLSANRSDVGERRANSLFGRESVQRTDGGIHRVCAVSPDELLKCGGGELALGGMPLLVDLSSEIDEVVARLRNARGEGPRRSFFFFF